MNKPLWLSLPFVALLLVVFPITLSVRNRLDDRTYGVRFSKIQDDVERQITPQHNNLNIVILELKNPGLQNKGEFGFYLKDIEGKTLRQSNFSGFNTGDPSALRIQFDPIPNSKGQTLIMQIKKLSDQAPALSIATDKDNKITFATYYKTTNKKDVLNDTAKTWTQHARNDLAFFSSWILLVGCFSVLALKTR